jgi:zinc finger protein
MSEEDMPEVNELEGQPCPMCAQNSLKLTEFAREIPYFGNVYIFSMQCTNCKYHKSDVEPDREGEPARYTLEISSEDDMNIRVIKSAYATVKIPRISTIEPGAAANGYVTNVEGILNRIKIQIEHVRDNADDKSERKKAKNLVKKLQNVMWGRDSIKLILEDPSGNSAIVSDKAKKEKN